MSVATEPFAAIPAPALVLEHRPWWRSRWTLTVAILGAMLVCYFAFKGEHPWPTKLDRGVQVQIHLDNFQSWLLDQRNAPQPNIVIRVFNRFADFLDHLVTWFDNLLFWMTWIGTTVAATLVAWRFGGVRAGIIMLSAFASFALMGLWEESIQTLGLMVSAVILSLLIGMPAGVLAGRSGRFERAVTPVLDVMQIVPAFAYLMPVVILFSVGPGAAVITTMIYAIPPAVRITALGIRRVPRETVEAAEALGSTDRQKLVKVQLPLARRMLLLSVNQTILFALSMVVIAGLIGGRGLGDVVTSGLNSYPALAILAGIAIVIMAMALDRVTEAVANRTDPATRHLTAESRRRLRLQTLAVGIAIAATVVVARVLGVSDIYHRWTARDWILARIQSVLDYIANPSTIVFKITDPIGNFIVQHGLAPLRDFFVLTPWFVTVAALSAIALVISGRRAAAITLVMFVSIGVLGQWEQAMDTFSQVLVATGMAVVFGVVLGVWAAESPRVDRILRPINDVLQTLPQLVYLVPFVYLMPVSIVPGVLAAVLYAVPVVIRLVAGGIREVPSNSVEAAVTFGATRRQVLTKVKVPLAQDAIMLAVNQGIIMVLAVVVIGGLVGSGGLGYEVAQGLDRSDFGLGVVASLAILALGIALDRVTQATRGGKKGQEA
jgi:glycine betaine/proline transport system permease protein